MLQLLSQHPLLIYIQKDCVLIEAVPESSLVAFLYPHVVQWEWEIGEKAETELTEIEVYSVLRNGFGQYNTEYYWGHEDGQRRGTPAEIPSGQESSIQVPYVRAHSKPRFEKVSPIQGWVGAWAHSCCRIVPSSSPNSWTQIWSISCSLARAKFHSHLVQEQLGLHSCIASKILVRRPK